MGSLEAGRGQDDGAGWMVALLVAMALGVLLGTTRTRPILALPPGPAASEPVGRVLDLAGLPETFTYGGLVWQAEGLARVGVQQPLLRVGWLMDGFPIYRRRERASKAVTALYLPARAGQASGLYVEYGRAP